MNNQSEDRILGYVGTYPVGDYSEQTEYEYLNVVTHKGSSYVCIKEEGCTAIEPPNEECWQLFAGKGDTGEKGEKGDIGPTGPKPVNGVDYNTNAEREEFKNAVVADSKADLEKYITEKETQLDNYTKDKETKLDDYVTDTVKPAIDTYVTDTTKKDIDKYEKEKEKVLDTYTDTKKTEIDNYATNISKPALDQYEKDKEAELETAKNTAISEYDAHVESVLTETEDLFNALDTEKASGTELYIEDAKPCRIMNIEIDGMYKQETTTGANFLNLNNINTTNNGITIVSNTDGSLKINGKRTVTPDYFVITIKRSQFIPKGTKLKIDFGTTKSLLRDGIGVFVWLYNQNKVQVMSVTSKANREVTLTEDVYYVSFGLENIDLEKTYDISNLYVFLHSTENTIYESYTGANPSPSPDYSQEIEQIENVKLMHDSSNLFNVTDYTILDLIRNGNAEITKTKDNFSFVTSTENYCGIYIMIAKMKAYIDNSKNDTTYNISFDVLATQNTKIRYGTTGVKNTTINTNKTRISFKGILLKPFTLYSMSQQAGIKVTVSNIKVTKNEDTESTLYKNQTINIDLKGNKLCAVSDTIKDKLLIDRNGNVALQKNVSLITLKKDNIVSRTVLSNGDILYRTTRSIINSNNIFVLCNYYIGIPNISSRKNGTIYCNTSNSNSVDIIDNNASITTADEYKTFVENKQIEVYYALATPEIIDLGQLTELPKTFEGINNIWAETNLGNTEIEIEYVQDVKKLLEKQAEQQNARLDNIEALLSTTETSALLLDNMQTDLEKEVE